MNPAHALMIKTNHYLIKGGELTQQHKATITSKLLAAKSTPQDATRRFAKIKGRERDMYPFSYVLPYNGGEKPVTILNQRPKTQILSMNSYELEILRLLCLFAPNDPAVQEMTGKTIRRLKNTCFGGKGCSTGECYDAGLVTLRFAATAAPKDIGWMANLVSTYNGSALKRKRSRYYGHDYLHYYSWYYWLCLSELPQHLAEPEIARHANEILSVVNKGLEMTTEANKVLSPVKLSLVKNCISRLPAYAYIGEQLPCESKDGRLHLDFKTEHAVMKDVQYTRNEPKITKAEVNAENKKHIPTDDKITWAEIMVN